MKLVTDQRYPNLQHRNGIPWDEAPLPRRIHRCRTQTTGTYDRWHQMFDWCACGAKRKLGSFGRGYWYGKNARRRGEVA